MSTSTGISRTSFRNLLSLLLLLGIVSRFAALGAPIPIPECDADSKTTDLIPNNCLESRTLDVSTSLDTGEKGIVASVDVGLNGEDEGTGKGGEREDSDSDSDSDSDEESDSDESDSESSGDESDSSDEEDEGSREVEGLI
ncbi:hypothetical protein PM082_009754 [Marasmius tenuissimus]|nr:hypothetical protein PM082_009754 [Marasmius tenuissimus]